MALKTERKTQAQACYDILEQAGYKVFIGTKPHNCHLVTVFTTNRRHVTHLIICAMHNPAFEVKKVKGYAILTVRFRSSYEATAKT